MAPKGWATPEQLALLQSNLDKFIEAQKNNAVKRFHNSMAQEFFEKFPELLDDTEILELLDDTEMARDGPVESTKLTDAEKWRRLTLKERVEQRKVVRWHELLKTQTLTQNIATPQLVPEARQEAVCCKGLQASRKACKM
jgi:hypothetical protein